MSEGKNILDIRVKLKGEVRTRFLRIKSAKGLTNNTEVLRHAKPTTLFTPSSTRLPEN